MEMFRQIVGTAGVGQVVKQAVSKEEKESAAAQEEGEKEGIVVESGEGEKNLDGSESVVVAPGGIGHGEGAEVSTDGTGACPFFNKE